MTKDSVLALLRETDGFVSGERMSRTLHLSRTAVWKAVQTLRAEGYAIESVTNRGYRLSAVPDKLDRAEICRLLGDHPWAGRVEVLDEVDSTNTAAKHKASGGAPEGTVVIAERQTGGKGRLGRSFASPGGVGLYLSVVLRPNVSPPGLMHVTAVVAEAAVEAIAETAGVRPGIKWTNDLVLEKRKLVGILTELSIQAESKLVDYVVVGIGTNCNHGDQDFPPEVRPMAISLREATGRAVDRNAYAAALIRQLHRAAVELFTNKEAWLARYAADCVTIGKDVKVVRDGRERLAHADGIDENAALLVTYDDGAKEAVTSGEVSVRGLYGYI